MKKIVKLVSISKDDMFENLLQNYPYKVIRAYNSLCVFTIFDFSLIYLNDLIKSLDDKQVADKRSYVVGYAYIKNLIDFHLSHLGLIDVEIAKDYKKPRKNPNAILDVVDLEQYDDGEIILNPLGVVFQGKKVNGKQKKHFLYTNLKDMYSTKKN